MTDDDQAREIGAAFVGDGYDPARLLTAKDVADLLQVHINAVYRLPIPQVRLSQRRVRFRPHDVKRYINSRCVPREERR